MYIHVYRYFTTKRIYREANDLDIPAVLSEAVAIYSEDLPHAVMHFPTEYRMWDRKVKQHVFDVPTMMIDALQACDLSGFPNIRILLQLSLTIIIAITSCKSGRGLVSKN